MIHGVLALSTVNDAAVDDDDVAAVDSMATSMFDIGCWYQCWYSCLVLVLALSSSLVSPYRIVVGIVVGIIV